MPPPTQYSTRSETGAGISNLPIKLGQRTIRFLPQKGANKGYSSGGTMTSLRGQTTLYLLKDEWLAQTLAA